MEAMNLALQGTLDVVSVADVLQLLATTAKTGRLELESGTARGVVWVSEGQVTAVTGLESQHQAPIVEFLFWFTVADSGWFTFEVDDHAPEAGQPLAVDAVVAELAALSNEWDELHRLVPSLSHRVGLVARLPGPDVTIDAARWPAVVAAASEPSVQDLGKEFGLGDLDALRAVRDLVSTGAVEIRSRSAQAADPGPPAAKRAGHLPSPAGAVPAGIARRRPQTDRGSLAV
jgi:hypothetical protein